MNDLVPGFFDDEPRKNQVDKGDVVNFSPVDTLLPELPMTHGEAVACDKRIDQMAAAFYEELRRMRDRQGWRVLGFTSWESYLRKKADKAGIDRSTIIKRLQAGRGREQLAEQGINTRPFNDSQILILDRLDTPEQRAEAAKLAQELSQSNPPNGKARQFHHAGKVYTEFVRQAVQTVKPPEEEGDEDDDPFDPSTRQNVPHKPSPPPKEKIGTEDERELADYEYCQHKDGSEVLFVGFSFEDGRRGEVWLPIATVRRLKV